MTEIKFNSDLLFKSSLTADQLVLLLLIHKKDYKAAERFVLKLYGWTDHWIGEIYTVLEEDGWIKINGTKMPQDIEIRQKFLELINTNTDMGIKDWIDEYRNLFKGKKPGTIGDRDLCIKHMTWLLTEYPEYTKEDVMKAAAYYISTCAKDGYKYLMKSNYLLSKELPAGGASHHILTYLEETKSDTFIEPKDFTVSI